MPQPHLADIVYHQGAYRLFGYWWSGGVCGGDYQPYHRPRFLGKTYQAAIKRLSRSHLIWAVPVQSHNRERTN